jgi:hypothetical protein
MYLTVREGHIISSTFFKLQLKQVQLLNEETDKTNWWQDAFRYQLFILELWYILNVMTPIFLNKILFPVI